eukprot:TRINITY_DN896_c0_g4_i1.p1 TRINITY_DN896_c0_g4~~TRINITY_DN896_c0_g4_i1.p1  ORF type:complete len:389 (+),score=60.13 TRINITY_DN896_c0_g4_i1:64-1230(+)
MEIEYFNCNFSNLSYKIQLLIFEFLPLHSGYDLSLCCSHWKKLFSETRIYITEKVPPNMVVYFLLKSKNLTKCVLKGPRISENSILHIGNVFKKSKSLYYLSLANIPCREGIMQVLSNQISKIPFLKSLKFMLNSLNLKGLQILSNSLSESVSIKEINLGFNNFAIDENNASIFQDIFNNLSKIYSLEVLDFWECQLGDEGIKLLSEHLPRLKSLQSLILKSNDINDEGIKNLSQEYFECRSLDFLDLKFNNITSKGLDFLSNSLQYSNIMILDLSYNDIDDEGMKGLSQALIVTKTLKALYLSNNEISDDGIILLSDSLSKITNLELLDIRNNIIKDEGGEYLCNMLQYDNQTLKSLAFFGNQFNEKILESLKVLFSGPNNSRIIIE